MVLPLPGSNKGKGDSPAKFTLISYKCKLNECYCSERCCSRTTTDDDYCSSCSSATTSTAATTPATTMRTTTTTTTTARARLRLQHITTIRQQPPLPVLPLPDSCVQLLGSKSNSKPIKAEATEIEPASESYTIARSPQPWTLNSIDPTQGGSEAPGVGRKPVVIADKQVPVSCFLVQAITGPSHSLRMLGVYPGRGLMMRRGESLGAFT